MNKNAYDSLQDTIKRLRHPESGCPWDLKQNLKTLGPSLFEEVCECLDGIANNDTKNVQEELGDVIFTASLMSYILEQDGQGSADSIIDYVNNKMITRHPHVFQNNKELNTSEEVLVQWEDIKKNVEGRVSTGILDNIPKSITPLEKSHEIQKKVEKVGFDWENIDDIFNKIIEETNEVKQEIKDENRDKLELEIGDLLFSVVNLSRFLKINPSIALSRTNAKFVKRFKYIEEKMNQDNKPLCTNNFDIMDNYWNESKKQL